VEEGREVGWEDRWGFWERRGEVEKGKLCEVNRRKRLGEGVTYSAAAVRTASDSSSL
jgi:hypothetical protein